MRCYNNIKLHTRNLHNIVKDGIIQVMQTLKDSQAMWSFSAWKKSTKVAVHELKQFCLKVLYNLKKVAYKKVGPRKIQSIIFTHYSAVQLLWVAEEEYSFSSFLMKILFWVLCRIWKILLSSGSCKKWAKMFSRETLTGEPMEAVA
jgi:hypothetical protein